MRGPDASEVDEFEATDFTIAFGHNRLSILDLDERSNQPMWDRDRTCCLVFNGEIYNYIEIRQELGSLGYKFDTTSDTEVLLYALKCWGEEAIPRLNGMFAFAFYDKRKNDVLIVRDRFGVKPLFYFHEGNRFYFASTTRSLAPLLGCDPNENYARRGLVSGIYDDDTSFSPYKNILSLPGGHFLKISLAGGKVTSEVSRYYDLYQQAQERVEEIARLSEPELLDMLRDVLSSAIDVRLRSDVPVGISISGGLDSTTLAALMLDKQASLVGFTLGEAGNEASEGPLVDAFARGKNMDVHYVWPSPKDMAGNLWRTLYDQDAPFATGSMIAQNLIFQKANQEKYRVLLGGQGGDEAFMGYRKFMMFYFNLLVEEGKYWQAFSFFLSQTPMFLAELHQFGIYWNRLKAYKGQGNTESVLTLAEADALQIGRSGEMTLMERQCLDVTRFSLPTLLRYEDRNSMGNSVETRLPFMDYRLMELGIALPVRMKLSKGFGKYCLRQITEGHVPDLIRLARYKKGFNTPDRAWLQGGLAEEIHNTLADSWSRISSYFTDRQSFDSYFSPQQIIERPLALRESISLYWLAGLHRNSDRFTV